MQHITIFGGNNICPEPLADGSSRSPGQRPQNPPHLLQGQGLQEAHQPQSDAVQSRQGTPPATHPPTNPIPNTRTTTYERSC